MTKRKLTVEQLVIPQKGFTAMKIFSSIRLKGKWLKDAGFPPGTRVDIEVGDGVLIIRSHENKTLSLQA